jgi:hypothetical protein
MAEVVMDDMAIGNPVSPMAQLWRFWASFPGIHIAQFPFQVIGNCGVIFLMQRSNCQKVKTFVGVRRVPDENKGPDVFICWGPDRLYGNRLHNCRLAMCTI